MIDINTGVLNGTITRDAELSYNNDNKPVANIQIAYECYSGERGQIDATLWGSIAEKLISKLVKWKRVSIQYELQPRSWERDGSMRYKTLLDIKKIQLL